MMSNNPTSHRLAVAIAGAALCMASFAATAGKVESFPVRVEVAADGSGSASGAMRSARRSSNTTEWIGCNVVAFQNTLSEPVSVTGACQAQNAAGRTVACVTSNPKLLEVVQSATDYSFILFAWRADGSCRTIRHTNASTLLP